MICLRWYVHFQSDLRPDLRSRVCPNSQADKYVAQGKIEGHATFSLTAKTTDIDEKLTEVLASMTFDLDGKLMDIFSWQGTALKLQG